jgi:tRNA threonylcarbamoyladenosine biosynthesis protein TsaE
MEVLKLWENCSLNELSRVANELVEILKPGDLICFNAQMGAGKTTLIQEILTSFGIEELNGSPTFSLVNEYESPNHGIIYHMDLYRIEKTSEAIDAGIDELFYDSSICLVEWAEKVQEILPNGFYELEIDIIDDQTRTFRLKK